MKNSHLWMIGAAAVGLWLWAGRAQAAPAAVANLGGPSNSPGGMWQSLLGGAAPAGAEPVTVTGQRTGPMRVEGVDLAAMQRDPGYGLGGATASASPVIVHDNWTGGYRSDVDLADILVRHEVTEIGSAPAAAAPVTITGLRTGPYPAGVNLAEIYRNTGVVLPSLNEGQRKGF